MKKQTFAEYYDMMERESINEAPMAGFSFGGPTIDKGVQKGVEAAGKAIKKTMRRIDLNAMKNWYSVDHGTLAALESELSTDAKGQKVLVKDEYSVSVQGMRDAFVKYFPEILKSVGIKGYTKSTVDQSQDSKNKPQSEQSGTPTVINAFITQSPNRLIKATQDKIALGGNMGGKIVFVTTVDAEEVEHYYIGCDEKAYASVKGITKISMETAIDNKSFGKIMTGSKKNRGWVMWTSVELNPEEYNNSMNILAADLKTKFKPVGFESENLTIKNYPEAQGPYVGGDYGWVVASSGPQFPNAQIAVFGKTTTDENDKTTYNINVYGKDVFASQKYVTQVYEMIQAKVDATKVGRPLSNDPFAVSNAAKQGPVDPNKRTFKLEFGTPSALVDADFATLKGAKSMDGISKILPKLNMRELAATLGGIVAMLGTKPTVEFDDTKNSMVIKYKDKIIAELRKDASGKAAAVFTNYGHDMVTQGKNAANPEITKLNFKEGSI